MPSLKGRVDEPVMDMSTPKTQSADAPGAPRTPSLALPSLHGRVTDTTIATSTPETQSADAPTLPPVLTPGLPKPVSRETDAREDSPLAEPAAIEPPTVARNFPPGLTTFLKSAPSVGKKVKDAPTENPPSVQKPAAADLAGGDLASLRLLDPQPEPAVRFPTLAASAREPERPVAADPVAPPSAPSVENPNSPSAECTPLPKVLAEKERNLLFDFDSARIAAPALAALEQVSACLQEVPEVQILLEGHTDDVGPNAYNLRLGKRRAESVREHLVGLGVGPGQLTTSSAGEDRPVCTESKSKACRRLNRRIHFIVQE